MESINTTVKKGEVTNSSGRWTLPRPWGILLAIGISLIASLSSVALVTADTAVGMVGAPFAVSGGGDGGGGGGGGGGPTVDPTTTTLRCASTQVEVDSTIACTATVEDTAASKLDITGEVKFRSTDEAHNFIPSARCLPHFDNNSAFFCMIEYEPTAEGHPELTAEFEGDNQHQVSAGSILLAVARHETTTTLSCLPEQLEVASSTTCTATVKDNSGHPADITGAVELESSDPDQGTFNPSTGTCTPTKQPDGPSICLVEYLPTTSGDSIITASYSGDRIHNDSKATSNLSIIAAAESGGDGGGGGDSGGGGSSGGDAGVPPLPTPTMVPPPTPATTAPETMITRHPPRKASKTLAKFSFISDQPGSEFKCKLDGKPFRTCRSPFKAKVKPGRHTFSVRALSPQGLLDLTPARYHWTVSRGLRT